MPPPQPEEVFQLTEGVAALLGAVIGGLISLIGNWMIWRFQRKDESLRWQREDATRFHSEKRQSYARFLGLVHDLYMQIHGDLPLPPDFMERVHHLSEVHAEISLIAKVPVRQNADALRVLIATAVANRPRFQGRDDVQARFLALVEDFRESARAELGTPEPRLLNSRER